MSRRMRSFIGTIVMVLFVIVYALVVMVIAEPILRDAGQIKKLAFYVVAGFAWVLPMMPLISWMGRN